MGPVSPKKFRPKTCFLGWTKLRSGTLLPPIAPSCLLAYKIGEVRFSTKIQTENMFFGKMNSRGLLRQNWAKFSSRTIFPPNAPCSQLGQEKRYGPVSSKNSDQKRVFKDGRNFDPGQFWAQSRHLVRLAHKIGEVRFSTKIQTENECFGKTNWWGLLRQNWAKFSSGTILPPNASYSQLGPEKRFGAGLVKKFRPKTCF